MPRPIFRHFCCNCGDLRYGALAVAILELKFSLISLISASVNLGTDSLLRLTNFVLDQAKREDPFLDTDETGQVVYNGLLGFFIISLVSAIINIVLSSLVIWGIIERKHILLFPWICISMCAFGIFALIMGIVSIFTMIAHFGLGLMVFVLFWLIPSAIFGYMWCVVYSYYAVLQEENSRGLYDKQPYRR